MPHTSHILVVDDSEDATFFLSSLLALHGFEASVAASGQQALNLAQAQPFDAVILDLELPDMQGLALAQGLRALPRSGPALRLFALSGHAANSVAAQQMSGWVEAYLTKPVDLPALLSLLGTPPAD